MSLPLNFRNYGALLVVYLIWGTTLAAMSIGVDSIAPALLACLRFSLAGILLVLFCLLKGEVWPRTSELKAHLIIAFLLFFAGNSLSCWAMQYISTGLGGVLIATTPFWMVGLSALMPPREKIDPWVMAALSVGFLGIVILLWPQLVMPQSVSFQFWIGVLCILITSFFWSAGSIYSRNRSHAQLHSETETGIKPTSILMALGIQNLFAGIMLIPVCGLTHALENTHPTADGWWALVYLILLGTIAATSCYYYVLQTMPIAVTSTFAYVTPVITVLFGWFFLQEELPMTTTLGTSIILLAVYLVQRCNARKNTDESPVSESNFETNANSSLKGASS